MSLSTEEPTRVASTFGERYRWWSILILLGVGLWIAFFLGRQAYASLRRLIEGAQRSWAISWAIGAVGGAVARWLEALVRVQTTTHAPAFTCAARGE